MHQGTSMQFLLSGSFGFGMDYMKMKIDSHHNK